MKRSLKTGVIIAALCLVICTCFLATVKPWEASDAINSDTAAAASAAATEPEVTVTEFSDGTLMEVYFFQAGKADATLLTTENYTVLIDCGVKGFGQTILDYLAEKEIDHIDYLIVTHFDQDHVGGAAKVINNIPVYNVLQNNSPKDSSEYEKYVKALTNAGIEPVTVTESYSFTLDGVSFTVDAAKALHFADDESNNSSLLVTVVNGENTFLFMGDAQTERLEEYLEGTVVDCDVLKVPHHGGEEILMEALIRAAKPELAVITSSDEEPEAASTTAVLDAAEIETYLTREGDILMVSDGTTISVVEK